MMATSTPTPVTAVEVDEPASKRQKKSAKIHHVRDFSMRDSAVYGALTKSAKCSIVPLSMADTRPILVQLGGGGTIPSAFGVDRKEGEEKATVTFEIGSDEDHEHLERLTTEFRDTVCKEWGTWFPDVKVPAAVLLADLCNSLVGERKKKRTGDEFYPGMCKASLQNKELNDGTCVLVNAETKEKMSLEELPGKRWKKIILEFKFIYILSSKSYGLTRRLRYLSCEEADDQLQVVPLD
jgi:hypothetical protein